MIRKTICRERSLVRNYKNKFATMEKSEGSPRHTKGFHSAVLGAGTIKSTLAMEMGRHGAIRGHMELAGHRTAGFICLPAACCYCLQAYLIL